MVKKFILMFFMLLFIFIDDVKASTYGKLNMVYEDGIYYTMTDNNGGYMSYPVPFYNINGLIVYCIEPGENINTWYYVGTDGFVNSDFDSNSNNLLNLIGHYGYNYPGHNTIKYRMATQELIWELIGKKTVDFWNKQYGYGERIDVTKEKEEIMYLVNSHDVIPSFDAKTFTTYVNKEIIIDDTNNVLGRFQILSNDNNNVQINKNKLYVTSNKPGLSTIRLTNLKYDDKKTMIFIGDGVDSQKLGMFRIYDDKLATINIKTIGAKLKVIKIDEDSKEVIKRKGIKFKIRDLDTDSYICENSECIFETNENGMFITKEYLAGNYQIEELDDNIYGYLYNSNPLKFTIDENTDIDNEYIYTVEFENKKVLGKIEINVIGERNSFSNDTYYYEKVHLENAIYGLYAACDIYDNDKLIYKANELVSELITDEFGQASLNDLVLGKYYLKQLETVEDNMLDKNRYEFTLDYVDSSTEVVTKVFNLENYLPKGSLSFVKIDSNSEEGLDDTLMEIYYVNELDDILVYRGYTNLIGNIGIGNLPMGKYYIKEIESKKGYVNDNEIINFEISNNNEVVKISMKNRMIFNIPSTFSNRNFLLEIIGIVLITICFWLKKYEKA